MFLLLASIPAVTDVAIPRDPSAGNYLLLGAYLAVAIGISFLCSLLEAGILSLPTSHVELMARENKRGGKRLKAMKANIDRPLAAILTLNTIAHTIGAAGVGAQILVIYGSGAVALGSIIVTLLILVFSEIIPKSIGASRAKPLAAFTAYGIQGMIWLTFLILIPLQWISSRLGGGHGIEVTRDEVAITAELGRTAGVINPDETRVIRNLLRLDIITVEDIMTPRPVVFMLPHDATANEVLAEHGRLRFSRIPLQASGVDDVVSHVTRSDIHHAKNEDRGDQPLSSFAKPLEIAQESDTVANTLERLIQTQQHQLLVQDEFGGTAGLVTLEDCIETLLGVEIVDETDTADDMREAARKLLERRRQERDM